MAKYYIGANKDIEVRKVSSSGGIFTALSQYVFMNGGIVFAASFDYNTYSIKHIMISDYKDLNLVRKSKYVCSDFKCIEDKLEKQIQLNRIIMFVGTPCQAAYIKKKYGNYNKLFVIDLFCHGVANAQYFRDYLRSLDDNIKNVDFRGQSLIGKNNYQFVLQKDDGIIDETYENNIFTKAYVESLTIMKSCFFCKLCERIHDSDITLGDFEWKERARERGISAWHPSIIAINSEVGKVIFGKIKDSLYLTENITNEEIAFYYRAHDYSGLWGYNLEKQKKFETDYLEFGFIKAAYKNIYPKEFLLIQKMYDCVGCGDKSFYLYGNGNVAKIILKLVTDLYPECKCKGIIVTNKSENDDESVVSIDKYIDEGSLIVIGVSEKYRLDVKAELDSRGIKSYIGIEI